MRHKGHDASVKSMIKKEFNRLTVLEHVKGNTYKCQCKCGKIKYVRGYSLKTNRIKSCGCLNNEPRIYKRKEGHLSAKKEIYKRYKAAAIKRKYIFELSLEDFVKIIEDPCVYCGLNNSLVSTLKAHRDYTHNGIDRVENKSGYTLENSVSCCIICNNSKAQLSLDKWEEWLVRINNFKKQNVGAWVKH